MNKRIFSKPAKSAEDLITFLKRRGLLIANQDDASHAISYIGYYHLKIYMRALELPEKKIFRDGTTFEQIVDIYEFDRRLRLICLDAVERIEVALRAHIINIMGIHGGPHFYYEEKFFETKSAVTAARKLGENGKHLSITHYRKEYHDPSLPPIWSLMEASTFGEISRMYADLEPIYREQIAGGFNLDEKVCVSWFRTVATLRNTCAHHGRLYNAEMLVNRPKKAKAYSAELADNRKLYSRLVVLKIMLNSCDLHKKHDWSDRVIELIENRPAPIELNDMGIPTNWTTRPLWN